jgi:hypothetical protein
MGIGPLPQLENVRGSMASDYDGAHVGAYYVDSTWNSSPLLTIESKK